MPLFTMRYYVTRARGDWSPGQPHPGYDEHENGLPTGRIVGKGAIRMASPEVLAVARHSGLVRDLKLDSMFRDALLKFEQGSRLNDNELRFLLQFFGVLVLAGDMLGQRYGLFTDDVKQRHTRLIGMAAERGWSQALISMYGTMARDVFQRIY